MITLLVTSFVIITILGFCIIKQMYVIANYKESAKDDAAKIKSLLNYVETLTAKKVKKK